MDNNQNQQGSYSTPGAVDTSVSASVSQVDFTVEELADLGYRLGNGIIDNVLVTIIWLFLATALGDGSMGWLFVLYFVYYVALEFTTGKTVGKMLTGTVVRSDNGNRISFGQAVGSTLIRFVPFEPLSCLVATKGYGWHNRWSGTVVIKDSTIKVKGLDA